MAATPITRCLHFPDIRFHKRNQITIIGVIKVFDKYSQSGHHYVYAEIFFNALCRLT